MGESTKQQNLYVAIYIICCIMVLYFTFFTSGGHAENMKDQRQHQEVEIIDLSTNGEVNMSEASVMYIDKAHRDGISHRGSWIIHVRRSPSLPGRHEVLMVRRSLQAKTCPGARLLPGEHTKFKESYRMAAIRGSQEEFGIGENSMQCAVLLERKNSSGNKNGKRDKDSGSHVVQSRRPVLFRIEYPGPSHRVDVQWTLPYLFVAKDNVPFKLDAESSVMQWVLIEEVLEWAEQCHNRNKNKNSNSDSDINRVSDRNSESNMNMNMNMNIKRDRSILASRNHNQHSDLDSSVLDCNPCEVKSFSVHNPETNTTQQTTFFEVTIDLIKDAQHFIAQNSNSACF